MKIFTIILACILICFTLFSICTGKKDDQDLGNSVEIDDTDVGDVDIDTETTPSTSTLSGGYTFEFRDPNNADGIVVTPKD